MYSTGAPRNWLDLRSEHRTIITCVNASYSSAVGLPRPQGVSHCENAVVCMQCMEYGVSISIMGARVATIRDIPYPSCSRVASSVSRERVAMVFLAFCASAPVELELCVGIFADPWMCVHALINVLNCVTVVTVCRHKADC